MKKYISYLITCLVLMGTAHAQETPPPGGTPKGFTLPEREEITLDNGLKVVLVPWGQVPKATVYLVTKTGYVHEQEDQVWLTRLLAKMMEEGSASRSSDQIAEQLSGMGGDIRVSVGRHNTIVGTNVLYEFTPDALEILAEVLMQPALPDSEIDRFKSDLKRNLSVALSRPQSKVTDQFYKTLFPDHAYGRLYTDEAQIDSYSTEQVRAFYEANYGAKRTVLYVAGKFDVDAVRQKATEILSSWKPGPDVSWPAVSVDPVPGVQLLDKPGSVQSTLRLGLPVVDPTHADYQALELTNALLGGAFGSRITSNIREDKGYTYSPYSTISNGKGMAVWFEQADVTTDVTAASLLEINKEINLLRDEPPTEEELNGIKNAEVGLFILQNSSGSGLINQLIYMDYQGLPESHLTSYVDNIMAVTPEQVQQMAQKYIDPEKMTIVIVGDKSKVQPQLDGAKTELKLEVN